MTAATNLKLNNPKQLLIGNALNIMQNHNKIAEMAVDYIVHNSDVKNWQIIYMYWRYLNRTARTEIVRTVYSEHIKLNQMTEQDRAAYLKNKYGIETV